MDTSDNDVHLHEKKSKNGKSSHKNSKDFKNHRDRWPAVVTIMAFLISALMGLVSETAIRSADLFPATLILIVIISIGIIFDIIGVAVTASTEAPFHARSARKMPEAAWAVYLVRHAGRVSNFCNDVVGDIAGVISGAAGAVIAGKLIILAGSVNGMLISILLSAAIASLTIGGKALGKGYAINNCDDIVYRVSYILYLIEKGLKGLTSLKQRKGRTNG